jgi:hypothetical protein
MEHLREIDNDNQKDEHDVQYDDKKISLKEAQELVDNGRGQFELRENDTVLHKKEHLR